MSRTARQMLVESLCNQELCFFTGAGMSISAPASLPLGKQIITTIVDLLLENAELQDVAPVVQWIRDVSHNIPMELLWEVLQRIAGEEVFAALSILNGGEPNRDHLAIALTCAKYGLDTIFTLNFDRLQEKAISLCTAQEARTVATLDDFRQFEKRSGSQAGVIWVVHLHNVLTQDNYARLATTVSSIGTGLPGYKAIPFRQTLTEKDVLCAGYSNGDVDTFPILVETPRTFYWYQYEGALPPGVAAYAAKADNQLAVITREQGEEGLWSLLAGLDAEIGQQVQKLAAALPDTPPRTHVDSLDTLRRKLCQKLGQAGPERRKASRLALAILCDELGHRDAANQILHLNLPQPDPRPLVNYAEQMMAGHLNERLGYVRTATRFFSRAMTFAPSPVKHQEAQLEHVSALLGLWKRNPLKIHLLIRYLLTIRSLTHSSDAKILQRVFWETGDLAHFIAEFLLIPSTLVLTIRRGQLSPRLGAIAARLDRISLLVYGRVRRSLLKVAAYDYLKTLRLSRNSPGEELPGYTSLALIRFVEALAGCGKLRLARHALSLLERGERYYDWVQSEHGKANAICARGVVEFYEGDVPAALKTLTGASAMYGSHRSGVQKTQFYAFRAKYWPTAHSQ